MCTAVVHALLLVAPAWSATYYLSPSGADSNPCTAAQPCQSLDRGMSLPGLGAGDTLLLHGGTYGAISSAHLRVPSGTSWSTPVTIASAPGEQAEVGGITFNSFAFTGGQSELQYVVLDRLLVDGHGGSADVTFLGAGVHHIRLQNSIIRNIQAHGGPCSLGGPEVCPGASGVGGGAGAHHIELVGNQIYNNGLNRLDHGIYATWPDGLIDGNDIHDNAGYGIQIYDSGCATFNGCAHNLVVRNNRVYSNRGDGGVTLNHGQGICFSGNTVRGNAGGGIGITYGRPDHTRILGNTIADNGGAAISIGAEVTNTVLAHNTVQGNRGADVEDRGTGTTYEASGSAGDCPLPSAAPPPTKRPAPRNLRVVITP